MNLMITRRRELLRRNPTRSSHCNSRRSICHWRGQLSLMKKLPLERTVRLNHRRPAVRNIWIVRSCSTTRFATSWSEPILSNSETASFEHWKWYLVNANFSSFTFLRLYEYCRISLSKFPRCPEGRQEDLLAHHHQEPLRLQPHPSHWPRSLVD